MAKTKDKTAALGRDKMPPVRGTLEDAMGLEYQIEAKAPMHSALATRLRSLDYSVDEEDDRIALRLPDNDSPMPDVEVYWQLGQVHLVHYGNQDLASLILGEIVRTLTQHNAHVTVREV